MEKKFCAQKINIENNVINGGGEQRDFDENYFGQHIFKGVTGFFSRGVRCEPGVNLIPPPQKKWEKETPYLWSN